MKTEKNISEQDRIRILSQYLGQPITTHPNFRPNGKESLVN